MAYWWVSQNQTYKHERNGEYLWAPNLDSGGKKPFHWASMNEVQQGDIIFSYVAQKIVSVSIAKTRAYDSQRPQEFKSQETWKKEGKKIDAQYNDLENPIHISNIRNTLLKLLPDRYSPLTVSGSGNQGYLFPIPPNAGRFLLQEADSIKASISDEAIIAGISNSQIPATEKDALVKSRIGQGKFKKDLLVYWDSKCAVTGFSGEGLLRASHIKPWRDSNNVERLDKFNGLLLSPSYDAAFDGGYISFKSSGEIIISDQLSEQSPSLIGINPSAKIQNLNDKHHQHLEYHRDVILKAKIY